MDWWLSAKPGDKVVCIKHGRNVRVDGKKVAALKSALEIGRVYMIRDVVVRAIYTEPSFDVGLFHPGYGTWWIHHSCFRPVHPKSTEEGMKMIRKLLDSVPVKEDA